MVKRNIYWVLLLLVLIISACSTTPQPQPIVIVEPTSRPANNLPQTEADVPRVTVEEALTALNSGAAVIVDVRSTESFVAEHIAGALSIPLTRIESNPASVTLDKNQWIITYCT
jgi:3-mercaptopyruvate sulfurtransferase SseA